MFRDGKSGVRFLWLWTLDCASIFSRYAHRFDGCNQLSKYSQLDEHKKLCSKRSNMYECPVCPETIKYCYYNVYMHFKEEHPKLFFKNTAMFNVELETDELQRIYLYYRNNQLFFVCISYCKKSNKELTLNTLHLGPEENAWKILQNFTLQTVDQKVRYSFKGKRCSGFNRKVFEDKIYIRVDDFPKNVVVCKFDINTEHVDTVLRLPNDYKEKCGTLAPANGEDISVKSIETALKDIKSTKETRTATEAVGAIPKGTLATVNGEKTSVKSTVTPLKGVKSTKKTRTAKKSVRTLPKEVKTSRGQRSKNERPFDTYTRTRQPRSSYSWQQYCEDIEYELCHPDESGYCDDVEYELCHPDESGYCDDDLLYELCHGDESGYCDDVDYELCHLDEYNY